MQTRIPCVIMRGGTSRGPFFLASDLPGDAKQRDDVLLAAMGSPHEYQVDGIGGAMPLTSKVAIISKSRRDDADVDYLFAQVLVDEAIVDTKPNCGNMLVGVGPFAIEAGLVPAGDPETVVRIYNVNTQSLVEAIVQTPDGRVTYEGTAAIDGVRGTAAPVGLNFTSAIGAVTGKLLPTGKPLDVIDGIDVSCVDVAMPMILMRAEQLGKTGYETPNELDADKALMERMEAIRRKAGVLMGMGDVSKAVVPKIGAAFSAAQRRHHHVALLRSLRVSQGPRSNGHGVRRFRVRHPRNRRIAARHAACAAAGHHHDRASVGHDRDRPRCRFPRRQASAAAGGARAHRAAHFRRQRARASPRVGRQGGRPGR